MSIGDAKPKAKPGSDDAQQDRAATPKQVLNHTTQEYNHVSSHFHVHTHR